MRSVHDPVGHQGVHAQGDLVGRHDFLTADIHHRFAQVDLDHFRFRRVAPEGVQTRRQRVDVLAVDEQDTRAVARDRAHVQQPTGRRRPRDDRQLLVLEPHVARIDHFDAHVAQAGPVGVQARRQHVREPAVHPDQAALVVLQVQHDSTLGQRTRLDDQVELLVHEPRIAPRHDLDTHLSERIEDPVLACAQQTLELFIAEQQTNFVAANLDSFVQEHQRSLLSVRPLVWMAQSRRAR